MPEFSPTTFLEVWDKTVENHSNDIFLIFENSDGDSIEWNYGDFDKEVSKTAGVLNQHCLLYTSPSPRDRTRSRMPSSA